MSTTLSPEDRSSTSGQILSAPLQLMGIQTRRTFCPMPRSREHPQWAESWDWFSRVYRPAMEAYVEALLRKWGQTTHVDLDPEEIVSQYIQTSMEKGWLQEREGDDRIRSFRAFLRLQLRRFTIGKLRKHIRGESQEVEGVELERLAAKDCAPDADLDRAFLRSTVSESVELLRVRNERYALVFSEMLENNGKTTPELARQLGKTAPQMRLLRHRSKRAFEEICIQLLRATCDGDDSATQELLTVLEPYFP